MVAVSTLVMAFLTGYAVGFIARSTTWKTHDTIGRAIMVFVLAGIGLSLASLVGKLVRFSRTEVVAIFALAAWTIAFCLYGFFVATGN
ncbi:hypothetical protein TU74_08040 [Pseudomonas lundensis]|nr:hypothetical protein TU74_08040 [Pseudomonas lundensis]